MFDLMWKASLIVALVGLGARYFFLRCDKNFHITWRDYSIALAVLLFLFIPLSSYVGFRLAYDNAVTYNENWTGYETKANWYVTKCERDGDCAWHYDCDPYVVMVPYECGYWSGSGNNQTYVSQTCYMPQTEYHNCPYATEEWAFTVDTTLGAFTIADHNIPTDPVAWRDSVGIPNYIPRGIPNFWQAASDRLNRNEPGPVTVRKTYPNYILASQKTLLKKYSDDIDRYKRAGQLPMLVHGIHDFYQVDRVYSVNVTLPGQERDWQAGVNYFNAALGTELQGDLHLVIVNANDIDQPDTYTGALSAYWQSPEFGKDALSKNGIVVVLGTKDGTTVEWARAATGMPLGNEEMLIGIGKSLKGVPLGAQSLFGVPTASLVEGAPQIQHKQGTLEQAVFGPHKFNRIRMRDYKYLAKEIEPTGNEKLAIYGVIALCSLLVWGICIWHGRPRYEHRLFR